MASIHFEIKGDLGQLPVRTLQDAIDLQLRMLDDLDRAISKQRRGTLEWVVANVASGSIVLDLQSQPRVENLDVGLTVAREWAQGWRRIEEEGATPAYLTFETMQKLRQVTRLIGTKGLYGFVAETLNEKTEVTARSSAHMEQLVALRHHALGSVEGTIETVSVHRGKHFVVYHSRTNKAVSCQLEQDDLLKTATDVLGRRVSVMGMVHSNAKGEPVRVEAQGIRVLREPHELPTTASLTGIDPHYTGGLTSDEFIRQVRSG